MGALVRARGREWVVLPDSTNDVLLLRPLGGSDAEVAGLLTQLEPVEHAQFPPPDPNKPGDHLSAQLLRDALRLGFRHSAGPFRSFGQLAFEPRPYQLVPLLMALRQDPVRLLIADDVGIGKTIEAALIARELLDTGAATRLAVLCPPHLAKQWQQELKSKFHIDATQVLASTAARLERDCAVGQTIFDLHPYVIVSTDFIKSERRRHDFLRTCPELVIVDEAHTCAAELNQRGTRHQRHELVKGLAGDPRRHLILVTASPHSGKEEAFRSLLALLDDGLANLPDDLSGPKQEPSRRRLARYMVQRRRGDIRQYLDTATVFPDREEREDSYTLAPEQKALFHRMLAFARESVQDPSGGKHHQRVRYWSALALLRALASSPDAAEETLKNRATTADTDSADEADAIGRRVVLDEGAGEDEEVSDVGPGGNYDDTTDGPVSRRLRALARDAGQLRGDGDAKLVKAAGLIRELVDQGFKPIVFCRFIATAEYVASELRQRLPKDVEVQAVTGRLPADEREARVHDLDRAPRHVLVATDCLSEGINLQSGFDAVFHYDLSWNPTRHEQREGRVDRFGQPRKIVRTLTYYGRDNAIDGIVLDVLLRKHRAIRNSTGVSVPVPGDAEAVMGAMLEGLLLRGGDAEAEQQVLLLPELKPKQERLFSEWELAAEREKRSRTMFAQESIKVDEVARELRAARDAIGRGADVGRFVRASVLSHGGTVHGDGSVKIDLSEAPAGLRDAVGVDRLEARFDGADHVGQVALDRTHPFVAGLAGYVLDTALDPPAKVVAGRCGVIRTADVKQRTTLVLVRFRFHLLVAARGGQRPLLAEESGLLAFEGAAKEPHWLNQEGAELLLAAKPAGNVDAGQAAYFLKQVGTELQALSPQFEAEAHHRSVDLLEAHRRVRREAGLTGSAADRVQPQLPVDVLGVYVYLPAGPA